MLHWMMTADGWIAFVTLFAMEVVLGIDNIIFISILAARLPLGQQANARYIGLALALVMRILLLLTLTTIMGLTAPIVTVLGEAFSGRDLVLLFGGLFLIGKATLEIHHMMEGHQQAQSAAGATFGMVIAQIVAIDIVFSLDSIITAVGLTNNVNIMIAAVVASMAVMMAAMGPVSDFINRHPTTKMLALAFLVMIGMMLVVNSFDIEVPKGYVYTAMAFAVLVEMLNVMARSAAKAVHAGGAATPERAATAEELLAKAWQRGVSAIQLTADSAGSVRGWVAEGGTLREDAEWSKIPWTTLRSAIEAWSKPSTAPARESNVYVAAVAVSPPDAQGAALITLAKPA